MLNKALAERALDDESGFGLVEIVISMFLLALVSISLLPLLITGLKQAAANTTTATATQIVQDQLELVRTQGATCVALTILGSQSWTTVDPRGVELHVDRTIGACPASGDYPGTVSVEIEVERHDGADVTELANATTLVFLETEN